MWELYLITRLDSIICVAAIVTALSAAITIIAIVDIAHDGKGEKKAMFLKKGSIVLAIGVLTITMVPSKKDALLIYGVGTTLDYIQENETAKQLPDKCIEALDAWVESLTETKK